MAANRVLGALAESLAPNRRNLAALVAVGALALAVRFGPHWALRYGAALAAFSVWMAWFVATGVQFIDALQD
ncbi:MAG: hypothetical protein ABEJ04_08025 [Halobacteriaceae archaeon]